MDLIDILIAEPGRERAERIRGALAPTLNRVEVFTDPDRAADRLLFRGEFENEKRQPELVIIDADMIGPDCWKVLAGFRERERGRKAVVVVTSDDPDVAMAERAMEAGANWFKGNPLDLDTLAEILEDIEDMGLAVVPWPRWVDEDEGEG